MKITDVRCHVMRIPRAGGGGVLRNWVFVEVNTDEGITGIGEATTEYHELAVKAQVESELKPRLIGQDPTDVERIWQGGYRDYWWRGGVVQMSAVSGVDQALWDIAGKAAGVPVFKLLGGKLRERVRCYIRYGPEFDGVTLAEALPRVAEMGFDAFKCGWGERTKPYNMDEQLDRAVAAHELSREVLGPGSALMIDAAAMFDPVRAHRLIERLRPLKMHFVEEPTNQDTVEPTLRLKRDFPDVPIAAGERMITRWGFRDWFERQAIDVCQADMCHAGGISEMMKIAHFAEGYGITIAPHNPYGPVALAACGHFATAIQNFNILEHCPIQPWFDDVQTQAVPVVSGHIDVAELDKRSGLGVELDMELVRAHGDHVPMAPTRYETKDGSTPLL